MSRNHCNFLPYPHIYVPLLTQLAARDAPEEKHLKPEENHLICLTILRFHIPTITYTLINRCAGETPKEESKEKCSYCGRTGHGKRASLEIRNEKCKAYRVKCNKGSKTNHYEKQCLSKSTASANNLRLGRVKVRDGGKQRKPSNRNMTPLDHMTYDQAKGRYVQQQPPKDASIAVTIQVDS